jgi:hypothetical protein
MRSAIVVMLTLTLTVPALAQKTKSQGPTPPPAGTTQPTERVEGTVEAVDAGGMTLKTSNERLRVDLSQVRVRPRPGDRVAVEGVMGPEREVMRATAVAPASTDARPETMPPAASPREDKNPR